jgi:hypothetical protein
MANLLSSIMSMLMPQQPQVIAQDRYLRTPITQQQQMPGAAASYDPNTDTISVGDINNLPVGSIAHEVTHRIYNKAGLSKMAPQLLPSLAKHTADYLRNSSVYSQLPNAGSPEQLTDEGLSYSTSTPVMMDQDYVGKAASLIKNKNLQDTLTRLFSNRLNAKSVE